MSELDQDALDLQRRYAGHVLTQNGSVSNANDTGAPDKDLLELTGHDNGAVEVDQEVQVVEVLKSPPVAAFIDTLPMPIRVKEIKGNSNETIGYTVFLKVPAGFKSGPGQGNVRLRWPIKGISATPQLRLSKQSAYKVFELSTMWGEVGKEVTIGKFPSKPIEVEFGDYSVPQDKLKYDEDKKELKAPVPDNAGRFKIRIGTADGKSYRSDSRFTAYNQAFNLNNKSGKVDTQVEIGEIGDFKSTPIQIILLRGKEERILNENELKLENGKLSIGKVPGPHDDDKQESRVIVQTADQKFHISKEGFFRKAR